MEVECGSRDVECGSGIGRDVECGSGIGRDVEVAYLRTVSASTPIASASKKIHRNFARKYDQCVGSR